MNLLSKAVATWVVVLVFAGCAPHPNIFRLSGLRWQADSIQFVVTQIDTSAGREHLSTADVDCLSCNTILPPFQAHVDSNGLGHLLVADANYELTARLRLHTSGLDTLLTLRMREPSTAQSFYKLDRQLVGRVVTTALAILYTDSTADKIATSANPGDAINLFGETSRFFVVFHPLFADPLYLSKSSAIRLY